MDILNKCKNKLKYIQVLKDDFYAMNILKKSYLIKKNNDGKINVGFIFQLPEIWEKQELVFEKMMKDNRFNPTIIVVPSYNFLNDRETYLYGEEKEYIEDRYPKNRIKCYFNKNKKELELCQFDYIFYSRPYEHYLPLKLRAREMVKHARLCYIPYGKETLKRSVQYDWNFLRYISFIFLAGKEEFEFFKYGRKKFVYNKWQHLIWCGYPIFEECHKKKNLEVKYKSILWTPRWSYDKSVGGSHFLEYKNIFLEMAKKYKDIKFIFRPHPLMWENLLKNNLMSSDEIAIYNQELSASGIKVDKNRLFSETADNSSILITDMSSVLPEFFLTERPIIYCPCDFPLNDFYNRLIDGTYVAWSEDDIKRYLAELIVGKDPKLEQRKKIIKEQFSFLNSASNNILNCIIKDWEKR